MNRKKGIAIHWFRRDLRLTDNPALAEACSYEWVVPIFIWDPNSSWERALGRASAWWLNQSLHALSAQLQQSDRQLIIAVGNPVDILGDMVRASKAEAVFWNRLYEPKTLRYDASLRNRLSRQVKHVGIFDSYLLVEPDQALKKDGTPYRVYTAFYNTIRKIIKTHSLCPKAILPPLPPGNYPSAPVDTLNLVPLKSWTEGLAALWYPGEEHAQRVLKDFVQNHSAHYKIQRDLPYEEGTSRLSPFLHFGEISVASIFHRVASLQGAQKSPFLKELIWREFSHHLLVHFPNMEVEPLNKSFEQFPWQQNESLFKAWTQGRTGYPIVDAGMRQLWKTGWMHNRVRMIVASFLVKDLLIPWQRGADWFWDTLVDANLANNTQNWQWVAGCGADAAPYFRIFNPILQGEKFDPEGLYVKTWCPELSKLPKKWVHKPWAVPEIKLPEFGILLGKTYPFPIVDHVRARLRALLAYDRIRKKI